MSWCHKPTNKHHAVMYQRFRLLSHPPVRTKQAANIMRFTSPNLRQLQRLPNIQEGEQKQRFCCFYILFQPKPAQRCYGDKRPTDQPERVRPSEQPNRSADVLTEYLRLFQADTLPNSNNLLDCEMRSFTWIIV